MSADGAGDRLGDAAFLGFGARMRARDVDEGDDRQAEALGELHDPHRLAVALGMRHPEVAPDVLVGVGALLLADDATGRPSSRASPATIASSSPNRRSPWSSTNSSVIAVDELERPRPAQVARQLDPRPDRRRPVGDGGPVGPAPLRRDRSSRRRSARRARRCGQLADPVGERREERQRPERRHVRPRRLGDRAVGAVAGGRSRRSRPPARRAAPARATTRSMKPWLNRNSARWKPAGSSWRDRAGRHARAGEADERVRLGDVDVADRGERREHAAGRRVGQDEMNGTPAVAQALERGERLGQLHQRERALLHPRAARGAAR